MLAVVYLNLSHRSATLSEFILININVLSCGVLMSLIALSRVIKNVVLIYVWNHLKVVLELLHVLAVYPYVSVIDELTSHSVVIIKI